MQQSEIFRCDNNLDDLSGVLTPYYAADVLRPRNKCTLSYCNDVAIEYIMDEIEKNKDISIVFVNVKDLISANYLDQDSSLSYDVPDMIAHFENILSNVKNATNYNLEYSIKNCIIQDNYYNKIDGIVINFKYKNAFEYATFWYTLFKLIRIYYVNLPDKSLKEYFTHFLTFSQYADQKLLFNCIKHEDFFEKYLYLLQNNFNFLENISFENATELSSQKKIDLDGLFGSYLYARLTLTNIKNTFEQ